MRAQGNTRCSETRAPRYHDDDRDTHTRKSDNSRNTTLPHASSARTGEHLLFRDTRTREHDGRDTRTLQFRLDNNNRNSTDNTRQLNVLTPRHRVRRCPHSMVLTLPNLGLGSYSSRPSRAIRAGQPGERVVRLVSSLTGPAANLLIGMTLEQLDNYNCLRKALGAQIRPTREGRGASRRTTCAHETSQRISG